MKISSLLLLLVVLVELKDEEKDISSHFYQNDYHVILERGEAVSYNKRYIKRFSLMSFKYNRTTVAFNSTIQYVVDVGHDLELVTQMYKFSSNEYRLFPLRVELNFCKLLTTDIAGVHSGCLKCGNFSSCPFVKEQIYHLCYFTIDQSKLPPYIPSGRYMAEVQGTYLAEELFLLRVYSEIARPLPWH